MNAEHEDIRRLSAIVKHLNQIEEKLAAPVQAESEPEGD